MERCRDHNNKVVGEGINENENEETVMKFYNWNFMYQFLIPEYNTLEENKIFKNFYNLKAVKANRFWNIQECPF